METLAQPRHETIQEIIDSLMRQEGHLSYSSISAFFDTPETFIDYKLGKKKETDAMIYGSMLHCLVLEPDDFENRYFMLDDAEICTSIGGAKPRATNQYKTWKAEQFEKAAGKIVVEPNEAIAAKIAAEAVRSNRASRKILNMCPVHEIGIEWEYKNFKFKGFKDGEGDEAIFDLKSMPDATPKKVQREIIERGLHIQAAMYLYGSRLEKMKDYYILAVDKSKGVSVHKIHSKLIEYGMIQYNEILNKFNHCILTDSFDQSYDFWAERNDGIYVCEKPAWLY